MRSFFGRRQSAEREEIEQWIVVLRYVAAACLGGGAYGATTAAAPVETRPAWVVPMAADIAGIKSDLAAVKESVRELKQGK